MIFDQSRTLLLLCASRQFSWLWTSELLGQQAFLQEIPGPKEMGLDRANGHGENIGHFFIRHILEVAQDQDNAIPGRQLLQVLAHDGLPVVSFYNIFCLLLLVHPLQHLLLLYSRLQGFLPLAPFKLSQTTMVGDAIEPGRKERFAAERWQPSPRCQKSLLTDLACLFVILQHTVAQIEDAALVPLHEEREGILLPLLTGFHELCVIAPAWRRDNAWKSFFHTV